MCVCVCVCVCVPRAEPPPCAVLGCDAWVGGRSVSVWQAYLHSRMRSKVNDFLQVLNRAKPGTGGKKKKRNI